MLKHPFLNLAHTDLAGNQAIHLAAYDAASSKDQKAIEYHTKIIQLLIERGASPEDKNTKGETGFEIVKDNSTLVEIMHKVYQASLRRKIRELEESNASQQRFLMQQEEDQQAQLRIAVEQAQKIATQGQIIIKQQAEIEALKKVVAGTSLEKTEETGQRSAQTTNAAALPSVFTQLSSNATTTATSTTVPTTTTTSTTVKTNATM